MVNLIFEVLLTSSSFAKKKLTGYPEIIKSHMQTGNQHQNIFRKSVGLIPMSQNFFYERTFLTATRVWSQYREK